MASMKDDVLGDEIKMLFHRETCRGTAIGKQQRVSVGYSTTNKNVPKEKIDVNKEKKCDGKMSPMVIH